MSEEGDGVRKHLPVLAAAGLDPVGVAHRGVQGQLVFRSACAARPVGQTPSLPQGPAGCKDPRKNWCRRGKHQRGWRARRTGTSGSSLRLLLSCSKR